METADIVMMPVVFFVLKGDLMLHFSTAAIKNGTAVTLFFIFPHFSLGRVTFFH